ncbi:MAG: flagellar export protein FliJ [Magnetococcales bacterium]|nr:flagellar export protein FliJ [Magnetococcales bacterium]NGZ28305.1 flagellar export protein FliJ [Magnetococcales bacterium]
MNRLSRLVELRKIQEEVKAAAFGRTVANLNALKEANRQLQEETASGRRVALQDVDRFEDRLPPHMYEDYYKGQSWRQVQLQEKIAKAEEEVKRAQKVWQDAHIQVKQVEKLASREDERLRQEANRRELHTLDDMGALRHSQHQE